MKVYGEFEIHETFKVTNAGIVLTGNIISEKNPIRINIGDKISFEFDEKKIIRKIKGYENGISRNINLELSHMRNIGILIECESDSEIESLKNWKPEKVMAELIAVDK